jgi:hypothetical protein
MFHKTGKLKARELARYVAINDDGTQYYFELNAKGDLILPSDPPVPRVARVPFPQIGLPRPASVSEDEPREPKRGRGTCEFLGILDVDRLKPSLAFSIAALLNPRPKPLVSVP